MLHAARWKYMYMTQKWCKKSPSRHHRTTLSGCVFASKVCIDNRKTRRPASADRTARAANFRRDLEAALDFNWWLLGKPVSDCMFAVIKMELSGKTVYGPTLKTTQLSAHAQNHASPKRCRKSFTMIFLGDHDIPLKVICNGFSQNWWKSSL